MPKIKITVTDVADYVAHRTVKDHIRISSARFLKLLRKEIPGFEKPEFFFDEVVSFEVAAVLHGLKKAVEGRKVFQKLPQLFLRSFYRELFENPSVKAVRKYQEAVRQRCLLFDRFVLLSPENAILGVGNQFTELLIQKETSVEHVDFIMAAGSHFFKRVRHMESFIEVVLRESEIE